MIASGSMLLIVSVGLEVGEPGKVIEGYDRKLPHMVVSVFDTVGLFISDAAYSGK
jgi:hypothetical protein